MDFLKEKWSFWFSALDVDHDAVLTQQDVKVTLEQFPKVEGLGKKEGSIADGIIEHWWNTYILKGRAKVTKEDFLKDIEKLYSEDKERFKLSCQQMAEELVGVIDTEHDNQISEDNYVNMFKAWGHYNEDSIRKSYQRYKPDPHNNGKVPVKEFVNDWIKFLTNEDRSKDDPVLATFEGGVLEKYD